VRQQNHKYCALVGDTYIRRLSALTNNKIRAITEQIKAGNYAVTACRLTGVSERTYYHWLALGRQQESSIYAEFCEAVEQAEAEREAQ
jgi:transposase